ncbi:MAG: hypothetical protein FWE53_00140 [Firmicutes bacterium]|nr:hypothetical protein [Bacillota bacterium]
MKSLLINPKLYFVVCMLCSFALSALLMIIGSNPFTDSFSSIGAQYRWLFAAWGVASGLAIFIGLRLLLVKLGIKNRWFNLGIFLSGLLVILTTAIIGEGGLQEVKDFSWWWHLVTAVLFCVLSVSLLSVTLIIKFKKQDNRNITLIYIAAAVVGIAVLLIDAVITGWVAAYAQILLINTSLIILFSTNLLERNSREKVPRGPVFIGEMIENGDLD